MNLHDWIDEVCDVLELDDVEVDEGLLAEVGETSRRRVHPAAPAVTTYLLGLAAGSRRAGQEQVEELAGRIEGLARSWGRSPTAEPDEPPADGGGDDYADDRDLGIGDEDDVAYDERADDRADNRAELAEVR